MSRVKVNKIEARSGNNIAFEDPMQLKSYTTTQRDALTSVAGDTIYNTTTSKVEFYDGSAWQEAGGVDAFSIEYLVIAGGGGGRSTSEGGSGGGAGGLLTNVSGSNSGGGNTANPIQYAITGTNYNLSVGAGASQNSVGTYSEFAGVTCFGGGGGHKENGGSGSGSQGTSDTYLPVSGGVGIPNQGYNGGGAYSSTTSGNGSQTGAGGGGAGEAGNTDGVAYGGDGVTNTIISSSQATTASVGQVDGSNVYYAGGGAGSSSNTSKHSDTALGGGGSAGSTNTAGGNGTANTGAGAGGAGGSGQAGGAGGSGVVILKYPDTHTISVGAGLTSSSATTTGYKMEIFTAGAGTVSFS